MSERQPDPSPSRIARMCARIRSRWTAKVYRDRAPHMVSELWTVPEVRVEHGRGLMEQDDNDNPE